jgi:hypothetical protein
MKLSLVIFFFKLYYYTLIEYIFGFKTEKNSREKKLEACNKIGIGAKVFDNKFVF